MTTSDGGWDARLAVTLAALDLEPRAALDALSALGCRAVQLDAAQPGLRPRDLGASARRDLVAALRRRSQRVAGIDLWIPPPHYVEAAHADRAVAAVRDAVELAAGLERCPVSLRLPHDAPAIVAELAAHAERHGVALADHEDGPPPDDRLRRGLDPVVELAAGRDPVQIAVECASRLVSARLVDLLRSGMRGPVGDDVDGRLDPLLYRAALEAGGYRGAVVIDARRWPDWRAGVRQSVAAWG